MSRSRSQTIYFRGSGTGPDGPPIVGSTVVLSTLGYCVKKGSMRSMRSMVAVGCSLDDLPLL